MLSFLVNCFTVQLFGVKKNVRKLKLVQNYACRIVTVLRKYDHISEALKSLKWLNVEGKLLFNDCYGMQVHEQPNSRLSSRTISTPFKNSPKEHQAK